MTTNTLDLLILVGSLVLVVAVGLWASRNVGESAWDYFLAFGQLPWWIIGLAFVSTSVSSEQIVGTVGVAYSSGMGVANWEWFVLPQYTLLMSIFIPIYLKNRIPTVPELLARRYGPLCGDIYSWAMLVAYVFIFLVPVLYGGSLVFSQLTGFDFFAILWVTVLLVAVYTAKGGLAAVVWTDAVQCLMLVGGGVVLFFVALWQVEGGTTDTWWSFGWIAEKWNTMAEANPDRFHLYRPPDDDTAPFLGMIAATFGLFIWYQGCNQVMIQRVLGARSTWDGLMGILFAGFINLLRPLVTCFLGFIVYHWIHVMQMAEPLERNDDAFPFVLKVFAPEWDSGASSWAGFLAAVMSTTSALANSTATIFSLNVYKKLVRRDAEDRELVKAGRIASVLALVIAALMAPLVEKAGGIFIYFQKGVTYLSAPFIAVVLIGFFWKRANYQGALFGLTAGLAVPLVLVGAFWIFDIELHWLYIGGIAEVLVLFGIVIVSLKTPAPDPERVTSFLWSPKLLAQYDEGQRRPWYQRVAFWWAVYAVIWFYLYWKFW